MNRSPDDIFAAQFWAWPDPAIKRDAHGRVLFINAAFLQLFGGSVEAWQGQTVQGWAPPQPGPTPARFEIRTPAQPGQPEQVYDWLELCGPDGSAFALARNVTAFMTQASGPATNPADPVDAAPVFDATQPPSAQPEAQHMAAAPAQTTVQQPPAQSPVTTQPRIEAQSDNTAQAHAGSYAPADTHAPVDVLTAAPAAAPPARPDIVPAAPLAQPPQLAQPPEPAQPAASQPPFDQFSAETMPPAPAAAAADEPREVARRALPIEDDEAVLGNNWRDAVIAKAVGDDDGDDLVSNLLSPDEPTPKASANAIRILLAEDNAINALLTRTLLEADGHTVETVEDGVLAVEAMKTQNYDMIFMDMRMPNMDGLEATRKIRALPNVSKDLPIVALTANAFDDDRNACFDSGMNDFMTKPVSAEELSEMVVRWTAQVPQEQRLAG